MVFKEAFWRMSKSDRMKLWKQRLENVDKAIEKANTGWQLEFWNNVRRQLVRQLSLLNTDDCKK